MPAARRNDVRRLDALVRATVPALTPHVHEGMLGYGAYRYRYKSGREGEGARVAIGAGARHVTLHVAALAGPEETLVEQFAGRLGAHARTGRTTVQFSKLAEVELEPLRELLKGAAELPPPGLVEP
ncbi:MAG: hypothetical protein JWO90_1991 [Solirubrobacterales bacterium]|jgi:hypothetical protein|nr:hypothetical protein [Solirubrobacterales bacterium]